MKSVVFFTRGSVFALATAFAFGLTACGPKPEKAELTDSHAPLEGALVPRIQRLLTAPYLDPCEAKYAGVREELGRVLDARTGEINGVAQETFEARSLKVKQMGRVRFLSNPNPREPSPDWNVEYMGWGKIEKLYGRIKARPDEKNAWLALSSMVRGLLMDDLKRTVKHLNYAIGRAERPWVERLFMKVDECLAKAECRVPQFTNEEADYLRETPVGSFYLPWISALNASDPTRAGLLALHKQLNQDYETFRFDKNQNVRQVSRGEFVLPVVGDIFEGARSEVAALLESIWMGNGKRLKIEWVSAGSLPRLFSFVFDEAASGRAFTRFGQDLGVHLADYVNERSVAHEVGHVLGLPDIYFMRWLPDRCEYEITSNDFDLMSDSDLGLVTADEWARLAEMYPLAGGSRE